jgi:hypothetical protein
MDASPDALRLQALLVAYAVAQVAALCTGGLFGVCSNSGTCSSCKADEIDAVLAGGALPATRSWEQTPPSSGEQPLEAEAMYVSCDPQLPLPAAPPPLISPHQ